MVAWCGGSSRSHSKGDGPNRDLTHGQPRTPREVLRGERPKRILVPFVRSKGTPSGKRPHQAGKPETVRLDGQSLRLVGADCVSLASPLRDGASLAHAVAPPLPTKPACTGLWRGPQCNAVPPPFAQGRLSQRSVPGGGAGLRQGNRRRTSPPQPGGYPPSSPRKAFPAERPT